MIILKLLIEELKEIDMKKYLKKWVLIKIII